MATGFPHLLRINQRESTVDGWKRSVSWFSYPICSMYGIFTYIYHKFKPNVGKIYHMWILWGMDLLRDSTHWKQATVVTCFQVVEEPHQCNDLWSGRKCWVISCSVLLVPKFESSIGMIYALENWHGTRITGGLGRCFSFPSGGIFRFQPLVFGGGLWWRVIFGSSLLIPGYALCYVNWANFTAVRKDTNGQPSRPLLLRKIQAGNPVLSGVRYRMI